MRIVQPLIRCSLPIAVAILIGAWWGSIVQKEDRAITLKEFAAAAGALAIAGQPMLLNEVIRAALRKID
jgi:hypothetical protein